MALTKPGVKNVWAETGDKTEPTGAEVLTGWPLSSIPPSRQRFNWILNFLSNGVRYLTRRGISDWAADETYEIGDYCRGPDNLSYRALTQNTNKTPAANAGDWVRWGFTKDEILAFTDGILTKNVAGGATVNLTADEGRNGIIVLTGLLTANISVTVPATAKRLVVVNNTTGAFTITFKTPLGTGVIVEQGSSSIVHCDATNVDFSHKSGATASQFSNNLRFATTEFVQRALGNLRSSSTVVSGASTLVGADVAGRTVQLSGAGPYTVNLPLASEVLNGAGFGIIVTGSGNITIQRQGADQIFQALNNSVTSLTLQAGDVLWFVRDGATSWNILWGTKLAQFAPQFAASIVANGYQKLPSGLIIQWGVTASIALNSTSVITLPMTFPNANFGVVCNGVSADLSDTDNWGVSSVTTSQFTLTNGGVAKAYYWHAIGY